MQRNAFYTQTHKVYEEIGEQETFSRFVRELVLWLLDKKGSPQAEIVPADRSFFNALNEFLKSEGEGPILLEGYQTLPSDFMDALRFLMDGKELNKSENVFNTGADARNRGVSDERQRHLAKLYRAISDYRIAKDKSYNPQEPSIKLWRQEVEFDTKGCVTRTINEVNQLDFDDHTILLVPGMSSTHDKMPLIQNQLRDVEVLLGGESIYKVQRPRKYTLYTLSYSYEDRMAYNADIHETNANPNKHIKPAMQAFVDEMLLPSLGICSEQPKKSLVNLKKALCNLNLYSLSYGTVMALQMRNAITKRLQVYGYSDEMIREALPLVSSLNICPTSRIDMPLPEAGSFSSIYAVSPGDLVAQSRAEYESLVPDGATLPLRQKVNDHTMLYWRETPVMGVDLTRLAHADADDTHEQWFLPSSTTAQPRHDTRLMTRKVMGMAGANGVRYYEGEEGLSNALRSAAAGKWSPEELEKTFAPIKLVATDRSR